MSVTSKNKLIAKLKDKEYRDAYAVEHVTTSLPFQIRALREKREWTQGKLAKHAQTTQTAISRIEDPDYGKLSLNTLYKLAAAFDVALLVKFVPFSRLLSEFEDVSPEALEVEGFEDEIELLEEYAAYSTTLAAEPIAVSNTARYTERLSAKSGFPEHVTYNDFLLYLFMEGKRSSYQIENEHLDSEDAVEALIDIKLPTTPPQITESILAGNASNTYPM